MVHFTKDSFVITISESDPFDSYKRLQKCLSDCLMLIFAENESIPNNEIIYYLSLFMSNLSEIESKQCFKIDKFVQQL